MIGLIDRLHAMLDAASASAASREASDFVRLVAVANVRTLIDAIARVEHLERENTTLRNQRDELRILLDRRPAMNEGLREAYAAWSASIYTLDWLDAADGRNEG